MVTLRHGQRNILIVNLILILLFSVVFIYQRNLEFILYVGVIIFFLLVILLANPRINLPNNALWGLTIWAAMHMAGGGLHLNGKRLYELMLLPLSGRFPILRYDQVVHIYGFGVATYIMYCLIRSILKTDQPRRIAFSIVIIMAGLGVGAFNEIIEFMVTVIVPETGVGDYVNTSLDLIADLIGSALALCYILARGDKNCCKTGGEN